MGLNFKRIAFIILTCALFILPTEAGKLQDLVSTGYLRPKTLKAISSLPKSDSNNPQKITSMFLEDMGYPGSFIKVKYFTSGLSGYEGDITGGYFNLKTGEMLLNPGLSRANPGQVAAIIRHELDHFQKAAQLCKAIGINNYAKIFGSEQINTNFWQKAMIYTKVPAGFDSKKYIAGMAKYTIATDMTSPYYMYDTKTDSRRNIFEISAYNLTEAIYEYYKIPNPSTTLEKVATAFNGVDWKVYNLSKKYPVLTNERVAIFDYFYAKTIVQLDSSMQQAFSNSLKSQDMNTFWSLDKSKRSSFYNSTNITSQTANQIISLLNSVNKNIPSTLTIKQTRDILELKYLSLRSALKRTSPSNSMQILLNLNKLTNDYLKYINTYSPREDGTKLKLLITRLQLLQVNFQMPDGQIKKIGKTEDTKKIIDQIYKSKHFNEICKNQNKNTCFTNIVKTNKLF